MTEEELNAHEKRKQEIERMVKIGTGLVTICTFVMNINEKRNKRRISL